MDKSKNIYDYKIPKSSHEETHYLFINGRITFYTLLLRFVFSIISYIIFFSIYFISRNYNVSEHRGESTDYNTLQLAFYTFENFILAILPIILIIFMLIQSIKRLHDVNKSGWYILVPIYGLFLLFNKGTKDSNNYGTILNLNKGVEYFDELNTLPQKKKSNPLKKLGISLIGLFLLLGLGYGGIQLYQNISFPSSAITKLSKSDFQNQTYTSSGMKWIDLQGNEYEDIVIKFTFTEVSQQENKLLMQCEATLPVLGIEPIKSKATIQLIDNTLIFEEGELAKNLGKGIIKKIDSKNITITDFNQKWTLHN
jgi:uncharacterized membrane protein YhaH (DUF805 family)